MEMSFEVQRPYNSTQGRPERFHRPLFCLMAPQCLECFSALTWAAEMQQSKPVRLFGQNPGLWGEKEDYVAIRIRCIALSRSLKLRAGKLEPSLARVKASRLAAWHMASISAGANPSMRLAIWLIPNPGSNGAPSKYFRSKRSRPAGPGTLILIFSENRPPRSARGSMLFGSLVVPTRKTLCSCSKLLISIRN